MQITAAVVRERLVTFYPLAEINRAAADATAGTTIKPVLRIAG